METTTPSEFQPADEMIISDLETLRVLADPMRLSIVEYLEKPSTVKNIAKKIGKPPTKLYYHFNLLEKHELIRMVDTRVVAGIIEKQYQASARYYRVDRGLLSPGSSDDQLDMTLSAMLGNVHQSAMQSFREGVLMLGGDSPVHRRLTFYNSAMMLKMEQAQMLSKRLSDLMAEFNDYSQENKADLDAQFYKLSLFYFPAEAEGDSASENEHPANTDNPE
jgi:DNA-binding transcriptional ArsR family regulator